VGQEGVGVSRRGETAAGALGGVVGLVRQRQLVEDGRRSLPADRGGHRGVAAPTQVGFVPC
jgi:hypothetical protein